ncbi:MAG: gliding motility-associated C-terminal domain-containing protein [Flavobacteriales bacterium]|nr:gliding motility-associated C-terminal domain-containing protein [Flavobacteriales bacterium]
MVDGATWETCTGTFYDSGGAGGNYGNSESMTAVLCPPGGAGSGPLSSITFTAWNVDLTGILDNLVIHNGASASSPVLATGSGLNSLLGQTFTSSDPSGCLTFVWTSDLLLTGAGWAASINTGPDAGGNGSATICANAPAFNLFGRLTGTPDAGGSWTLAGQPVSGTFTPGTSVAGVYTYAVAAVAPCLDASATVTVTVIAPPNAGTNAARSVCSSAAPFDLFAELGGTPQAGGAWTGPGGAPVSSTFTPGTSAQGVHTYTVLGTPPCSNATATVTVTVVAAPDPGTSANTSACSNGSSFSMISRLGGTPQPGGTWTGPGGAHGANFVPGTDAAGDYVYAVSGTAPCPAGTATLSVTVQTAPNAGTNGSRTVCSTDANFALLGLLGGSPNGGGTWTAPGGAAFSGTFIPGTSVAGVYTYTVAGIAPCTNASATVTVSVNTAPNAGTNASVTRCSNNPAFNLFAQLGGTPAPGGAWTGPGGVSDGTFTPGTSAPGAYTYTVSGTAPCANATAVVTVNITQAPNAGTSSNHTACATDAPFGLFALLGGAPNPGGTWTAPGGGASNGTFAPGTSVAGAYTYTVMGTAPCANATAAVTVSVVQPPNPGTNGSITVCSNGPVVNLFTLLGGSPASGGAWTRPNGSSHTGTLDPSLDPAGTYTYTVTGTAPCSSASSTVQVAKVTAPNAGSNGSITVCSNMAPFQLFTVLGGTPSGSGTWRTPTNAAFNGTFIPGTTAAGTYKYIVPGTAPCVNDTAFATVVVNQAPNAGTNATVTVCSDQASFTLISRLGGTPNAGGAWTGPGGGSFPGTYLPGTSTPGAYTYTVAGVSPCLAASAVVAITEQRRPVAGSNGSFSSCSTDAPVDLFGELGGTPDAGGSWTAPGGGNVTSVFFPGTSPQGIYTYTVAASAPCVAALATVTATVNQAPDAGDDATVSICPDAGAVNLFVALGGSPDAGGTWTDDDATGQLSNGVFTPTGLPAGDYDFTYTVTGNGQCGDASATVRVTIVAALDAGSNGTLNVCGSNNLVDLFTGLGGTPQQGGAWSDLSGTGGLTGQFFNATVVPAGTYSFRYELTGSASCMSDQAQVNVTVVAPRRPGTNGSITVCSNSGAFNLFPLLGGNPQPGGTWSPGNGQYDPATQAPAIFTYTLNGTAPCPNASATVTVAEVSAPVAGTSASTTVCSNDGTFNMTLRLGGAPQPGSWSFGGDPHGNLFTPGVDPPGVYVYTVLGNSPCGSAIATLTVTVNNAPNAGANADTTVCSNGQSFSLFSLLDGGAQTGGTWMGPGGVHNGFYVPLNDAPGDYFYTVTGLAPCAPDVAVVTVSESEVPNAGSSASLVLCSNGTSVNLVTALGGSPSLTGTWRGPSPSTAAFNGVFIPGTTAPGTYTYTVLGTAPCSNASASVTVAVNAPPNAGTSRSIVVCSSAPAFALVDSLGGSPALNGTWTTPPPTGPSSGVFTPGTSVPGIYTYTVAGTAPCANAVTTVSVTVNQRANAGNDANLSVCSSGGAQDMFALLGAGAQGGGAWTYQPTGAGHGSSFLPNSDVSGVYVYTVAGLPGCASDVALVSVTLNQAPNAGFNGLITVCDDNTPFQLVNVLNGSPQLNGTWTDPTPVAHTGIFVPGTNGAGVYTYTVAGAAPCPNAQAQVTVFQNERPYAGENGVASVCSNNAPFSLFDRLNNNPDPGGSWTGPSGPVGSMFDPASSQPGTYQYRIQGVAPCASDSATVTVFVNPAPNAGISTVAQICSSSDPVDLISLLGGTPGTSGAWSFGGNAHGPQFDPATDVGGAYVYTAVGTSPCVNAVSQVQITLVSAPSAGTNGSIAACIGDPAIQLASGLGGSPTSGGSWSDDDGTGALSGGVLNGTSLAPGTYHFTYTVAGAGPCPETSAVVTVAIAADLDAGDDASINVCENEIVDLFARLGGTPQPGGYWVDVDASGALIGGVFNGPQVADNTTWRFDHVLPAVGTCESDTATVTVHVQTGPFAGCDGFAGFCLNDPPDGLIGSLSCDPDGTGSWFGPLGAAHTGTFVPATDLQGVYIYVVPAIGSCAADTANVTVQVREPANAGQDASASICSTDAPVDLFGYLGANAQPGGTWTRNNLPFSGIYNPAVDVPGQYRYRVNGQAPCPADFAFVTVAEPQAAEAGSSATVDVCSDEAPFNMRDLLGGLPQQGGAWSGPGGLAHGQNFDPNVDVSGAYRYVVTGTTPCANDTAFLTVTLFPAPNAGADATVEACATQNAVDLFAALGAGAQTGGVWTDIGVSGALTGDVFNPSVAGNGSWQFQYAILATAPCSNAFSIVTVNVGSGASAGVDNSVTICGAETDYLLLGALAGDPDAGGTWTDPAGTGALLPGDTTINASLLPVGGQSAFVYTVEDAGCGNVQATVLISTVDYPDPGTADELVMCSTGAPLDLFAQLGGTPENGGSWNGPSGAFNGVFDPAVHAGGTYTYTVQGNTYCPDSSAVFQITVNDPPDAGTNGQVVLCDTLTAYSLITGLNGTPDENGVWTDVNASGGLTGAVLNTTGLEPGDYDFRYVVSVAGCTTASALVKVEVVSRPEVVDLATVCNEQDRTYVVTFTIVRGEQTSYQVLGASGSLSTSAPYVFTSDPVAVSQPFLALVSDGNACGELRVEAFAPCSFDSEVFVPESFSPNGDGVNETFRIPGIEGFPNNTISIFNRWGAEVYDAAGYDNNNVVWDGSSPDALLPGSAATGTYFYVLDLGISREPITGFIQLVR